MSRYAQLVDGVGISMPTNTKFRFACCDCGLVHDMVVAVPGRKIFGFAVRRNARATAMRRRKAKR
jgi:hypothetical protein